MHAPKPHGWRGSLSIYLSTHLENASEAQLPKVVEIVL